MNIDSALEKIYSLKQFHVKLGLDNITELLNYINNPQKSLKTFHIAGSNGKGSTCSFIASILQEYGYRVGLYTSPHLVRFNERIRINGIEISDEDIINFLERNKSYIDKKSPTFFEITTALAFEYFKENDVDYAVIETGLGGRLDATNVLNPLASVITSISLEHTHILGNTLEDIASEKGGIIKENTPVFIGDLENEAVIKICTIAEEKKSELYQLSDSLIRDKDHLSLNIGSQKLEISSNGLKGDHQIKNAALAIYTINTILGLDNNKLFKKGLDNVIQNSGIQGRYEKYGSGRNVIFDAAHNLEGVQIFINEFAKENSSINKNSLIFGAMKDKNIPEMLKLLSPYFHTIYVTSTKYERAATAEEIKSIADQLNINVTIENSPHKVVEEFSTSKKNECLVVIGSIYLLGDIKIKLSN